MVLCVFSFTGFCVGACDSIMLLDYSERSEERGRGQGGRIGGKVKAKEEEKTRKI